MVRIILLSILLAGCATQQPQIEIQEVKVAVTQKVVIEKPDRPTLAISVLTDNSLSSDVVKAYAATVEQLLGYSKELESIIDAYNKE